MVDLRDPADDLPADAAGFIVMGSPLAVYDDHPWMPRALDAARRILDSGRPALGVCFGHQLFAVARGGHVGRNASVEVGTIDVELAPSAADDPLFGAFSGALRVNSSHDDTVLRLPEGPQAPQVLGSSDRDRHQVLRWGPRAWSVQFHPEMRVAETVLSVAWRSPRLLAEGGDPAVVEAAVEDAPDGVRLLERFVSLARQEA